jgi:type IV secretory pathway TrbF-like protein
MHQEVLIETVLWWLPRIGVALAAAIIVLTIGLVRLARRPDKSYVLVLDHKKVVGVAYAFPEDVPANVLTDIIQDVVEDFIYTCRVVTPNVELERHNLHIIYARATGHALEVLDDYYQGRKDRDPEKLANDGYWRTVQDISSQHALDETHMWHIEWSETLHPPMGDPITTYWSAELKVDIDKANGDPIVHHEAIHVIDLNFSEKFLPPQGVVQEVHQ